MVAKKQDNSDKKMVTLFLSEELVDHLEKRAKKNMMSLPEQIEDILRRSTINQWKTSIYDEKIDDKLVSIFSRQRTGPKRGKNKKK